MRREKDETSYHSLIQSKNIKERAIKIIKTLIKHRIRCCIDILVPHKVIIHHYIMNSQTMMATSTQTT